MTKDLRLRELKEMTMKADPPPGRKKAEIFKIGSSSISKSALTMPRGNVAENQSGNRNESFGIFKFSPGSQ